MGFVWGSTYYYSTYSGLVSYIPSNTYYRVYKHQCATFGRVVCPAVYRLDYDEAPASPVTRKQQLTQNYKVTGGLNDALFGISCDGTVAAIGPRPRRHRQALRQIRPLPHHPHHPHHHPHLPLTAAFSATFAAAALAAAALAAASLATPIPAPALTTPALTATLTSTALAAALAAAITTAALAAALAAAALAATSLATALASTPLASAAVAAAVAAAAISAATAATLTTAALATTSFAPTAVTAPSVASTIASAPASTTGPIESWRRGADGRRCNHARDGVLDRAHRRRRASRRLRRLSSNGQARDMRRRLNVSLTASGSADHGGVVYDSGDGRLRVDVHLSGVHDGVTDPTPFDGHQNLTTGVDEQPSSTYFMCHASAHTNGKIYSALNPPADEDEFEYPYHYVKLYTQQYPPSQPPPPPPLPSPPPSLPPPARRQPHPRRPLRLRPRPCRRCHHGHICHRLHRHLPRCHRH